MQKAANFSFAVKACRAVFKLANQYHLMIQLNQALCAQIHVPLLGARQSEKIINLCVTSDEWQVTSSCIYVTRYSFVTVSATGSLRAATRRASAIAATAMLKISLQLKSLTACFTDSCSARVPRM